MNRVCSHSTLTPGGRDESRPYKHGIAVYPNPPVARESYMNDPFAPGLLYRLCEKPRKIVLVRASRIGDFLCASPAFRALRAALPQAEITMITLPLLQELVKRSPYLDRFMAFPGFPGIAEQFFDARCAARFFQEMQEERFDLAIQMQGSGVYSNPFTLMLGARLTAGFVREGDSPGRLDAALPVSQDEHEIRQLLAMTTFLGAPPQGEETEFPLWPQDHAGAEELLACAKRPLIGLHPAAREATRRWSIDRFAAVGTTLWRRHRGTIVILGDCQERGVGAMLARRLNGPCLNLAGKTSLVQLGAVISRLSLLVTNDSGPAHLAYALKTPTVTIFGSANPKRFAPLTPGPYRILVYDVPCRPCDYTACPIGYRCLEGVSVEWVLEATEEVIRK